MTLYPLSQLPPFQCRMVCRQSRARHAAAFAAFFVLGAGCLVWARMGGTQTESWPAPPPILYWSGAWMLFFALIAGWMARRSLRSSNWLLAVTGDACLVKFRSYLNSHLPDDGPQVAWIPLREIRDVRTETITVMKHVGGEESEARRTRLVLELKPGVAVDALADRLQQERERQATFQARDYPVETDGAGRVAIWWDGVIPAADAALRVLKS